LRKQVDGAQTRGWRLFSKNTGLCELGRGRIGSDACPVPEGTCERAEINKEDYNTHLVKMWRTTKIIKMEEKNISERMNAKREIR